MSTHVDNWLNVPCLISSNATRQKVHCYNSPGKTYSPSSNIIKVTDICIAEILYFRGPVLICRCLTAGFHQTVCHLKVVRLQHATHMQICIALFPDLL